MVTPITDEMSQKRFSENLERFAVFSKHDAELIASTSCNRISFCKNDNGDLNLRVEDKGQVDYVYSREDVSLEASNWFTSIKLDKAKIIYLLGIGLGAYYEPCKKWLQDNPSHFLIFLEDDKEMLYHFFQTELATEILQKSQVRILYIGADSKDTGLDNIITAFLYDPYKVSCLDYYKNTKSKFVNAVGQYLSQTIYTKQMIFSESLVGGSGFFVNYYNNLKFLPEAYLAKSLFGKFKNIPAIICGAGPSLEKNIDFLKTLGDRALLFAGGTAINAINSYGLFPHFAVGIDPNATQFVRFLSNLAYETPFFFRNRIYNGVLNLHSGPKLFVSGSGGYEVSKWLEKKISIYDDEVIDEGYNVINFSVSIARKLGCHPIILCGMDLSYTNGFSYVPGLKFHALHNYKNKFITKGHVDELIGFKDIYGKKTTTLWKWINEASWYTSFASQYPENLLINATEGGIGFPGIENMTLEKASEIYLREVYDLENRVHGEIQNSKVPFEINEERILNLLKISRKALGQCEELLKKLIWEEALVVAARLTKPEFDLDSSVKKIETMEAKLLKKEHYKYVLERFSKFYYHYFEKRLEFITSDLEKDLKDSKIFSKIELHLECHKYLQAINDLNKQILDAAIKTYSVHEQGKALKKSKKKPLKISPKPTSLKDELLEFYPNHALKSSRQQKNGVLEGSSTFYGQDGVLLARSWFEKGLREGTAEFYYSSGKLFATKSFKHGLAHGEHLYFYEEGSLKSSLSFKEGKLDGDVLLYYPDNIKKRELHFKNGKREGVEKFWNPAGKLIIEAFYADDKPIGKANWWYDNGILRQEVIHHENLDSYEIRQFTDEGKEVPKNTVEQEDYFDCLIKMTDIFMESINDLFEKTDLVLPILEKGDVDRIKKRRQELEILKSHVDKLIKMNHDIKQNFSGNAHLLEEPIWKSSSLREKIEEQLGSLIESMKKEIFDLQTLIQKAIDTRTGNIK